MAFKHCVSASTLRPALLCNCSPVDKPPGRQRAHQDRSMSRCFSSGAVVVCWQGSPASLPITALLNLAFTPSRISRAYSHYMVKKKGGGATLVWISPNLKIINVFSLQSETTWWKEIFSREGSSTKTKPEATRVS